MLDIQQPSKEYNSKDGMIYSCIYHVIFCPKFRRKVITGDVETRLRQIIKEEENDQIKIVEMETMPDHVHLVVDCDPKLGIYNAVSRLKGKTSRILREEFPHLKSKLPSLWTRSKFISSTGSVSLDAVKKYIESQKNV